MRLTVFISVFEWQPAVLQVGTGGIRQFQGGDEPVRVQVVPAVVHRQFDEAEKC